MTNDEVLAALKNFGFDQVEVETRDGMPAATGLYRGWTVYNDMHAIETAASGSATVMHILGKLPTGIYPASFVEKSLFGPAAAGDFIVQGFLTAKSKIDGMGTYAP